MESDHLKSHHLSSLTNPTHVPALYGFSDFKVEESNRINSDTHQLIVIAFTPPFEGGVPRFWAGEVAKAELNEAVSIIRRCNSFVRVFGFLSGRI